MPLPDLWVMKNKSQAMGIPLRQVHIVPLHYKELWPYPPILYLCLLGGMSCLRTNATQIKSPTGEA